MIISGSPCVCSRRKLTNVQKIYIDSVVNYDPIFSLLRKFPEVPDRENPNPNGAVGHLLLVESIVAALALAQHTTINITDHG